MSFGDSGAGIPGSRPRRCGRTAAVGVGEIVAGASDGAVDVGALLTRSARSPAVLHAVSSAAAAARPAGRRRITVSLRGAISATTVHSPPSGPARAPAASAAMTGDRPTPTPTATEAAADP